jgi:hypothetical protein
MTSENWCSVAMIAHKAKGAIMQTNPVKLDCIVVDYVQRKKQEETRERRD